MQWKRITLMTTDSLVCLFGCMASQAVIRVYIPERGFSDDTERRQRPGCFSFHSQTHDCAYIDIVSNTALCHWHAFMLRSTIPPMPLIVRSNASNNAFWHSERETFMYRDESMPLDEVTNRSEAKYAQATVQLISTLGSASGFERHYMEPFDTDWFRFIETSSTKRPLQQQLPIHGFAARYP